MNTFPYHKVHIVKKRSTCDIIWAFRWIISKAQKAKEKICITGIDLSSAFDTIIGAKLTVVLETVLDKDELQMVQVSFKRHKIEN